MTTIEQTQSQSNGAKKPAEATTPAAQEILKAETPAELHLALIKAVGLKNPEKGAELAFGLLLYTDLKELGGAFVALAQQQTAKDSARADARLEIEQREAAARIAVDEARAEETKARIRETDARTEEFKSRTRE